MSARIVPWVAWSALAVALLLLAAAIILLRAVQGDQTLAQRNDGATAFALLVYAAVGALLASRRPRNPIGWILLAMGLSWEAFVFGSALAGATAWVSGVPAGLAIRIAVLTGNFWFFSILATVVLVLFPDGRAPNRWWHALNWAVVAYVGIFIALGIFQPGPLPNLPQLTNPWGVGAVGLPAMLLRGPLAGLFAIPVLLSPIAIVMRFRRSSGVVREQLKWIASAGVLLTGATVVLQLFTVSPINTLDPDAHFAAAVFSGIPFALAFAMLPVAIGFAILRYRLYDIDLIIRRTLVYGVTSIALAVTFLAGVLLVQALLRPFTAGSELAVAASTLGSLALFHPFRARIQRAVDRRFFRARYDAARTIEVFSVRLRDEVDIDAVRSDLLDAVARTLQPASASVWLRERAAGHRVITARRLRQEGADA